MSSQIAQDASPVGGGAVPAYSLTELTLYFLRLGTFGFGGPVALVGYMHRDLVEDRKWISEAAPRDAQDYCPTLRYNASSRADLINPQPSQHGNYDGK